jgi:hypothetical protein
MRRGAQLCAPTMAVDTANDAHGSVGFLDTGYRGCYNADTLAESSKGVEGE